MGGGSVGVPVQDGPSRQVATMPARVITRFVDALVTLRPHSRRFGGVPTVVQAKPS